MNTHLKIGAVSAIALGILASSILPSYAGRPGMWCHPGREQRFDNRHPRRSQVLDRSGNLNNKINANRGNLDGHYGQLKREDKSIQRQAQRDARINGGYITSGQQSQLNREENRLNNQIKRDQ